MDLLVPGSLWLFAKGSGTSFTVGGQVVHAGSGVVDGGTAGDSAIGYHVPHAQETTTLLSVEIAPHLAV
jgi:hypothetical protein